MDLPKELRKWISAVIKQRSYLISHGYSKKNSALMSENVEYLKRRLDYYPFRTDRKISILFQQNKSRILSLLPGEGSSGYQKRQDEFNRYDQLTNEILTITSNSPVSDFRPGNVSVTRAHGGLSPSF